MDSIEIRGDFSVHEEKLTNLLYNVASGFKGTSKVVILVKRKINFGSKWVKSIIFCFRVKRLYKVY